MKNLIIFFCNVFLPFVSCVAAESSLGERLSEFHSLRLRRQSMHYREYNKEVERQWKKLDRDVNEVQKEIANGVVSERCKLLFCDDVIAVEVLVRMLPALCKLTTQEQKKALGSLMSATNARTRDKILVVLLFSDLPLVAFKEDAVQSRLVTVLREGKHRGGALYFFVEDLRWCDVVDRARAEADSFNPHVEDSDENLCAMLSMSALARHGDKNACERLRRCFKERRIESNRDLFFLCPILLLAQDKELAKDVLGLIVNDQGVRRFGEDCVPRASSFAHAAASACSHLIVGFPEVCESLDYEGTMKDAAEKWIAENCNFVFFEDFRRCLDTGCRLRREYRRCLRVVE